MRSVDKKDNSCMQLKGIMEELKILASITCRLCKK